MEVEHVTGQRVWNRGASGAQHDQRDAGTDDPSMELVVRRRRLALEDRDDCRGATGLLAHDDRACIPALGQRGCKLVGTRARDDDVGAARLDRLHLAHERDDLADADPERH